MEFIYIIIIISIIGIVFWYYKYAHKTVNSPSTSSNTSSNASSNTSSSNVNPDANTSSVSSSNTSPASTVSPAANVSSLSNTSASTSNVSSSSNTSNVSPASTISPAYTPASIKTPPASTQLPTPTPSSTTSTTTSTTAPISSSPASTPLPSPASVPPSSSSTAFTPSSSTVLSPMDNPFLANMLKKQQALDKTITPTQNYYGIYMNTFNKQNQYVINLNGQWYPFAGNPFNNYIYLFHKSVISNAPTISLPNITTPYIFATQIVPHPTTNIPILLIFYTPGIPAIGYEISPAAYTAYKFKPELINKFNTSKYQNLLTNYPNLPITPLVINSF